MIVKATRIKTSSGSRKLAAHVLDGADNEEIHVLEGCRDDLDSMVRAAMRHGAKNAIRHVTISPDQSMTREQARAVVAAYCAEFGGYADRAVLVEHRKRRVGGKGYDRHWHAMIPEVAGRKIMDSSWMRVRHEKLSRKLEIEFGHKLTKGRWNAAVEKSFRAEGRADLADTVKALTATDRPRGSFTDAQHRIMKRRQQSLPESRAWVRDAWERADSPAAFRAALADLGFEVVKGERKNVWLVQDNYDRTLTIGALDRLVKQPRAEVAARMAAEPAARPIQRHAADATPNPSAPAPATPSGAELDTDFIDAIDPNRPGDADRFMRQWSAKMKRQAAQVTASGHPHPTAIGGRHAAASWYFKEWSKAYGGSKAASDIVGIIARSVDGGRSRSDSGEPDTPPTTARGRQSGSDSPSIRSRAGSADGASPAAIAGPVGGPGRVGEAGPNYRPADENRSESGTGRKVYRRHRAEAWHQQRQLAGAVDARVARQLVTAGQRLSAPVAARALADKRQARALADAVTPDREKRIRSLSKALEPAPARPKPLSAAELKAEQERQLKAARQRLRKPAAQARQPEAALAPSTAPRYVPPWVRRVQRPPKKEDQNPQR
jgi:hypothetical protein